MLDLALLAVRRWQQLKGLASLRCHMQSPNLENSATNHRKKRSAELCCKLLNAQSPSVACDCIAGQSENEVGCAKMSVVSEEALRQLEPDILSDGLLYSVMLLRERRLRLS